MASEQEGKDRYNSDAVLGHAIERIREESLGGEEIGWVFHSRKQEVDIFTKTEDGIDINKGVCEIEAPASIIGRCLGWDYRDQWDEMYGGTKVLEHVAADSVLMQQFYKPPWPVSAREFIILCRVLMDEDGTIVIAGTSIPLEERPPAKGHVRGELRFGGQLITPIPDSDPPRCRVSYVVSADSKGNIPGFVQKIVNVKTPLCLAEVRKCIVKNFVMLKQQMETTPLELLFKSMDADYVGDDVEEKKE